MTEGACDVQLGDYDGDEATCFSEAFVTARKEHTCFECLDPIRRGQRHERVSGIWEGEWHTYRFCEPCSESSREFFDGGRTFGVLWDGMEENWDQGAHLQSCLNRLSTIAAKEHMRRRWLKWKGLEQPQSVDAVDPVDGIVET